MEALTMPGGHDGYIHGADPSEQRRLSRLNQLINGSSLSRLGIRPGDRVLDVGCGMGQLTREIARVVGEHGLVVGVERSSDQIAEGERQTPAAETSVVIRCGDATSLPLQKDEWGTFDVVHTRFLLEHLSDPQAVVDGMVRAARPGGRIVLEDDDHDLLCLNPSVPAFEMLWNAYLRAYEAAGRDPRIGRRLPALLARAGAHPVRCDWPFFGACNGSDDWDVIIENCRSILSGAGAAIRAQGVTDSEFERGFRDYDAWSRTRGAAFWYCTFWAEGVKPASPGSGG